MLGETPRPRSRPRRWAGALLAVTLVVSGWSSPAPAGAQAGQVGGFLDVQGNEFYAPGVAWLRGAGLTNGSGTIEGSSVFRPHATVTRAEMATFLWRLAGRPKAGASRFQDVPSGTWYTTAVGWLRAEGLTTGVGGSNRFGPLLPLTRAEAATFLWRFYGGHRASRSPYTDVPAGSYYSHAVDWMHAARITTGVSPTRFAPHGPLTRGQLATMLWRGEGRPPVPRPTSLLNCEWVGSQPDAQAWFDLYRPRYGDLANLDADRDGRACDGLGGVAVGCARGGAISMAPSVAGRVEGLLRAASAAGHDLCGFGFRSRRMQEHLRVVNGCPDVYTAPASTCRIPTARPGSSLHERGLAVDFTLEGYLIEDRGIPAFQWLRANAARFGFYNLPSEPWHWSTTGR